MLLRILFFLLIGYLLYSLFRLIFFIGDNMGFDKKDDSRENRGKVEDDIHASERKNRQRRENKVIELKKDQYKVE